MEKPVVSMTQFLSKTFLFLFVFISFCASTFAEELTDSTAVSANHEEAGKEHKFNAGEVIMEHISDNHEWHFFSLKKSDGTYRHVTLPLPIIIYSLLKLKATLIM